jgi:hypothetical protein
MNQIERFFARTVRPFFLFTGAGTALVGLYAFAPAWTMPNVGKLPYLQDYTIIIQHWGMMVCLMGVAMMAAAVVEQWRLPIFSTAPSKRPCIRSRTDLFLTV